MSLVKPVPHLPELLSPAGSFEALEAAILSGADAVYLGSQMFNARMNAHNFDKSGLNQAVDFAHSMGSRVYLTLNTQIYDREIPDALSTATMAAEVGVDGLIVADMGVSRCIHALMPNLPLHASTQFSCHNKYAGKALSHMGFSRYVMAREATLEDLRTSVRESGLEVEVFVHGALCVSHSGQCLFSSLVGGRSGNRGLCAQPCRLPYQGVGGKTRQRGESYPLSLKDLSLACHIPALIESGVASLKIEGRMKSPAYVGGVTAIYRRLLDERRSATPDEVRMLAELFSREGFTDGYFKGEVSNRMLGVRTDADKALTNEAEKPKSQKGGGCLPVAMDVTIEKDTPVTLTLTAPLYRQGGDNQTVTCTVGGEPPMVAVSTPTDEAMVAKQLSRVGGTAYQMGEMTCHIGGGLMVPVSKLNALRREGLEVLDEARKTAILAQERHRAEKVQQTLREPIREIPESRGQVTYTARFANEGQIPPDAKDFFDVIYLPMEHWVKVPQGQKPYGVMIPPVVFDREVDMVMRRLSAVLCEGARHLMVGNVCHIPMVEELLARLSQVPRHEVVLHGDFRLNVCNPMSAEGFLNMGLADVLMSPELTLPRMRDMAEVYGSACGAMVYGRIPLMLLEKCAIRGLYAEGGVSSPCGKAGEACVVCSQNKAQMVDRKGVKFPILRTYPHRNVVYNSRPLSMTDRGMALDKAHIANRHMIFSVETPREVSAVLSATRDGTPLQGEVSRILK